MGVRELHDRLSAYLEMVERGDEVIVTRRGKRIARLSSIGVEDPFEELSRRGLIRMPRQRSTHRKTCLKSSGSVSDLVAEQHR